MTGPTLPWQDVVAKKRAQQKAVIAAVALSGQDQKSAAGEELTSIADATKITAAIEQGHATARAVTEAFIRKFVTHW